MKKLITKVKIKWTGDEPISARLEKGLAPKVTFENGDSHPCDSRIAQSLIGRYKRFVLLGADDSEVTTVEAEVKPKKSKKHEVK